MARCDFVPLSRQSMLCVYSLANWKLNEDAILDKGDRDPDSFDLLREQSQAVRSVALARSV